MFNKKDFLELSNFQKTSTPCVSIYIPTYRAGNAAEDRLRFKNALSEASQQLTDGEIFPGSDMNKKDASGYLAPAYKLLEDETFWSRLSDGLAVFIGENYFSYHVTPINFSPFVYVHDHFYLRHLLPLLTSDDRFFVLALSQNEVRFFEGNATSISPVIIQDLVPLGMGEMVGEENNNMNLQTHSAGSGTQIYHGQGSGKDDKNENLKKYFRQIDDGLMEMLHDEKAPFIIYSVEAQIPIYKEISKYSNIYNKSITGNPEHDDPTLIHEKAWSIIGDHFSKEKQATKDQFEQNLADGKASFSIHHIVPAAINGKVETLFVDKNSSTAWGIFDEKNNTIIIHKERQPESTCLLNYAAVASFQNGGTVYNMPRMEFPRGVSPLNAIFRY